MDKKTKWIRIGSFGVDSGQVLITDPCYLKHWASDGFNSTEEIEELSKQKKFPFSYKGACARTLSKQLAGAIGNENFTNTSGLGVVSSTGWGDGEYPVFVKYNEEGRVAEIKIRFI